MTVMSLDFVLRSAGFGDSHWTLVIQDKVGTRARTVILYRLTEVIIAVIELEY